MCERIMWGIAACCVVAGILCLTLQSPEQTMALSGWAMERIVCLGLRPTMHELRSGAHVPMYFVLGAALALFGRSMGWSPWPALLIGCCLGAADECLKVFLPTREFDASDLCRDFVGVALAVLLVHVLGRARARRRPRAP